MKLNIILVVLILGLSANTFAQKKDKVNKPSKNEAKVEHQIELKKELEIDVRNRKVAILNNAANCLSTATDNTAMKTCLQEEKGEFDALKLWSKQQKAMFHIK